MKKLFALFLLVALVPFSVGCNLWSYDDPDPVATVSKSLSVKLPATAFSGIKAAVSYDTVTMTVNGIEFKIDGTPTFNEADDTWSVTFKATLTAGQVDAITGNAVPVVIKTGSTTLVTQNITFGTALDGATTTPEITVTATKNADGTTTFAVTAKEGTTALTTGTNSATATTVPSFQVASVTVMVNNAKVELDAANYNKVATITPVFTVELKEAYTNTDLTKVAWAVKVTNKTSNVVFTLKSTTAAHVGLFTVAAVGTDKEAVTVAVKTANGTQPSSLTANENYEVTLVGTDLTNGTAVLDAATFRFSTAQ